MPGITNVGISVAKLERFGWEEGARRVVDAGLRVTNLIGLGPFHLAEPNRWGAQRERVVRALDTATEVDEGGDEESGAVNAHFLESTSFQAPRSVRLNVGVRF